MLSASCTIIKGDLPVNLTWTFNDLPINHHDRNDITIVNNNKRVSFLSIDSVSARHAGRYKCIATNAAGIDSHTAVLAVNGSFYIYVLIRNYLFFFIINVTINDYQCTLVARELGKKL